MLKTRLIRENDYEKQAWKNGLGVTQQIAIGSGEPFPWRISSASLSAYSQFSTYPDYDRILVLLSGEGLTLVGPKGKRVLHRLDPFKFPGETTLEAKMVGIGRDFNLFLLRGKTRGNIYPSSCGSGEELQFPIVGNQHFIYVVEGELEVLESNSNKRFSIKSHETLQFVRTDSKEYLNLRAKALRSTTCLWVVIHESSPSR